MGNIEETTTTIVSYLEQNIEQIIISILFFLFSIKIINHIVILVANFLVNKKIETRLIKPVVLIVKYTLYLILIVILASFLGIETTSLLMLFVIGVIFLVVAMQTTLANVGSGAMLLVIKPFNIGNYVEINGKEGYVKEVNLYHTLLVLRDNSVVYVPNTEVLNTDIINKEKKRKRRVDINIYVSHTNDFTKLRKIILKTIKGDARVLDDPKPSVIVRDIDPYGSKVRTKLWVKKIDYWNVLYDYNEKILQVFNKANVKFPDTTVSVLSKNQIKPSTQV